MAYLTYRAPLHQCRSDMDMPLPRLASVSQACPLHKRACPLHKRSHRAAPQTFCLSLPLWPLQVAQRPPLSSFWWQRQRLPLEWAVDITEIELMNPISCPTTWPVLLHKHIRGKNIKCARPSLNFQSASAPYPNP